MNEEVISRILFSYPAITIKEGYDTTKKENREK